MMHKKLEHSLACECNECAKASGKKPKIDTDWSETLAANFESKGTKSVQQQIPQENKPGTLKIIFNMFKDYFLHSNEKFTAWRLLIGIVLCIIGTVSLMAVFATWSAGFWALLTAKAEYTLFLYSLGQFSLIVATLVTVETYKSNFMNKLSNNWSTWLRKEILTELFAKKNNFLDIKRTGLNIDNPDQRMQEDTKYVVSTFLYIGFNFFDATLTLVTFIPALWMMGGSAALIVLGRNIVIGPCLAGLALLLAIVGTSVTHVLGKSLSEKKKKNEQAEADYRTGLALLHREANNIALQDGEVWHQPSLNEKIDIAKNTTNERIYTETILSAFKAFYFNVANILPTICAAPLYFSGAIQLGQLMQVSTYFAFVNQSLSVGVASYESFADCKTSLERIVELRNGLKNGTPNANPKNITRKVWDKDSIHLQNVNIRSPLAQSSSSTYIIRGLELELKPAEHVLIQGDSGVGKSSVLNVLAGKWGYGEGVVSVPADAGFYFAPQRPVLFKDTLAAVLAYPQQVSAYKSEQYVTALQDVGGMDKWIPSLLENKDWTTLSGGEQQRIILAHVLLRKPKWVFLDESTSNLNVDAEAHVYQTMREKLKDTTIVSVSHHNTIEKYHSKVLLFSVNEEKEIQVTARMVRGQV